MRISNLLILLSLLSLVSSCDSNREPKQTSTLANAKNLPIQSSAEVEFPFDFPSSRTTADKGDWVLVPKYQAMQKMGTSDPEETTLFWFAQEMLEPGEESSTIKYSDGSKVVPNPYIVPLQKSQSAKVGDILLTWWQSGAGLQRAIVIDATDPKRPKVRYLDIEFDNPAKSKDKTTTIGRMEEQLEADTFVVLRNHLEPGTAVLVGRERLHGQIIKSSKDKVFVKLFAGQVAVYPGSEVTALPIRPNVKKHDLVLAKRFGKLEQGIVSKVDERIGRVWIRFDEDGDRTAVAFGNVMRIERIDGW